MAKECVTLDEAAPGVLQITIADQETKNSFSPDVIRGLASSFEEAAARRSCKVVVVTGYGNYFCSGGTRALLTDLHEGRARFSDGGLYRLPLDCEIPVIAAMQGHAIGGGLVLGLFCDLAVLGAESVYTTNFMKYGFTPGMGATLVVPQKLGTALGAEMLMTGRNYRGHELERRGAPFPVVPRSEVLPMALALAAHMAEMPRKSLALLKNHLTAALRAQLPGCVERELEMHAQTFHDDEVRTRIEALFAGGALP